MRPNNCKKCGGKMQVGGTTPAELRMQNDPFNFKTVNTQCPPGYYWSSPDNQCVRITPPRRQITVGEPMGPQPWNPTQPQRWHNTPEDIDGTGATWNERLPDDHVDNPGTGQSVGTYAERSTTETTTAMPHNWNMDVFLGLRGAQMAASFLGNVKKNRRMRDYDYKQQTALGQMNPMPISQFQYSDGNYTTPNRMYAEQGGMMNPYSYHSKYGGNIKKIVKDHKKWSNKAEPMDFGEGNIDNTGKMQFGGPIRMMQARGNNYHTPAPKYDFPTGITPTHLDSVNYRDAFSNAMTLPEPLYDEKFTSPATRLFMNAPAGSEDARKWMDLSILYSNAFKDASSQKKKKGGFALDELVVNDFVRKLMQFGRGPHPYRGYSRK